MCYKMYIGEKKEHHLILQEPKIQRKYCVEEYEFHLNSNINVVNIRLNYCISITKIFIFLGFALSLKGMESTKISSEDTLSSPDHSRNSGNDWPNWNKERDSDDSWPRWNK